MKRLRLVTELDPIAPQTNPDGTLHPQERALLSVADIIGYGGEAGSAKSWTGVYFAARWNHVPGFGALVTRRTTDELTGPGSLWEKARTMYRAWGAETVENPHDARWENGANVVFRHCQHEPDVERFDGKEYGAIVVDEAQYWTGHMIWYLWGRCRTPYGVRGQMLLTMNPDPDAYVRELFNWWVDKDGWAIDERCGVLRWCVRDNDDKLRWFGSEEEGITYCDELRRLQPGPMTAHVAPISVTFIHGRLADNHVLMRTDPGYGARIAMQDAVTRAKKTGNWNARAVSGSLFSRGWFNIVAQEPDWRDVFLCVRGWDFAGSAPSPAYPDPDWTATGKLFLLRNGRMCLSGVKRDRLEPGGVDEWVKREVRADGPRVVQCIWQDPAVAGKVMVEHTRFIMRAALPSVVIDVEIEKKDKITYASIVSGAIDPRTRANQILIDIVDGPGVQPFFSELEAFPAKLSKKDQVDMFSRAYLYIHEHREGGSSALMQALARESI